MKATKENPAQPGPFEDAPVAPVETGGVGGGAVNERAVQPVPRARSQTSSDFVRSLLTVRPESVPTARPDASGQSSGQVVAAAAKVEPTPLAERIAADCIKPSRFLTREKTYWESKEFEAFKEDIRSSDGNIQPIKVRPVAEEGKIKYEVAFGHRRHRACLNLRLPVLAVVEEMDDLKLFTQAVRENTRHKDCSAYARGVQFRLAIDTAVINEDQNWNELFGVEKSMVYKLLKLARLPIEIVQSFACPSQLQTRWGPGLTKVVKDDWEGVLKRVAEVAQWPAPRNPRLVLEYLLNKPQSTSDAMTREVPIKREDLTVATLRIPHAATGGGIEVEFAAGAVEEAVLLATLRKMLKIEGVDGGSVM